MANGDKRVQFRRRHSYATRSNVFKKVKTPGGKIVVQYTGKLGCVPRCGDTGEKLNGIVSTRPGSRMSLSRSKKTVSRAYGGTLSGKAVRDRIVRAFLIEEQKIVKRVLKSAGAGAQPAAPAEEKKPAADKKKAAADSSKKAPAKK
mmetsp:Transcript_7215/g.12932  ORF Transcript_7215/g.12932 Transcript_7215/m.12932 type:complete len:146 (-) Transcript_7215:124-561(-)|eukprot:CAMPEP_0184700082 /NCGR_PEP_ID=MMETSP0313-20130426/8240_1 /TAXON_ID=2792 /ORGANISM="Porphyridium aerugineum, Strain SAG 1380-2" /LENGTH=145 /DNA_ID=CAMNT_0027159471 /DNA_START=40 /DNA_END=477 /DNA_ORIENTATION=+